MHTLNKLIGLDFGPLAHSLTRSQLDHQQTTFSSSLLASIPFRTVGSQYRSTSYNRQQFSWDVEDRTEVEAEADVGDEEVGARVGEGEEEEDGVDSGEEGEGADSKMLTSRE